MLNELRNRGGQDILIASVDNFKGFTEAINACFPETEVQKCIVHQVRNSIRYISYKDVKKVTANLRPIYTVPSEEADLEEFCQFEAKWGDKYPRIVRSWQVF